ncbi:TetR/AcrR family transcriptional regulator [Actinomyces faecalis]|uniref:TetR/AcrR family transcriptional regulator n=1 Tax=Actinomyces faecalis TaxID=2722820 RepID=UPI001551A9C8|nr:TetR/AcrR family transcriptional regulator [Actinomyces faecalis]
MTASQSSAPVSASQPRRRGPGRPPAGSEDKRERVLTEAVRLFGAHGYAGTSLADIAEASQISKAGLLHHFSSKEELFTRVLERRDEESNEAFLGAVDSGDPWKVLDAFVRLVEHNTRHRELVAIYTATAASVMDTDHPAHAWFAGHLEASVTSIEKAFELGKERGLVRPDAPSLLIARTLTALSDGLQIQWLCSTTAGSAVSRALATRMVEEIQLYVDGLKERWRGRSGTRS